MTWVSRILSNFSGSLQDIAGDYIVELGKKVPELVVINADLAGSTRSTAFVDAFPQRSYNVGIAEQSMVSFAAGLAHEGFRPLVTTMAPFLSMRACEQVRTDVCYGQLPVIFMGTGAGYSAGVMGATHSALEDCAIMGGLGGMKVLEPGDPWTVIKMLDAALLEDGPVYIRVGREASEPIYRTEYTYKIGKALIPREGRDGAFIVSGPCVNMAISAADRLKNELGAEVRVVDMHTIKPIDVDAVVAAAGTGHVVCAQDHNIVGGLGYYVGTTIALAGVGCKYEVLGCPDKFVPLATPDFLYKINSYDADGLFGAMKRMLN